MAILFRTAIIMIFLTMALATGCSKQNAAVSEISKNLQNQDNLVEVHIFYPSTNKIIEETIEIERSKYTPDEVLRQLFENKRTGSKFEPVMPTTKIISVKVVNGMATVNFEKSVLDFSMPEINQQLVVAAVVKTLAQFPEIKQVKFQVEGLEMGNIGGKDIKTFWGNVTLKSQPWNVK